MSNQIQNQNIKNDAGFTLIELMVAVSVFSLVMTISMGSILSVFDANKKSQTLRTVMDNMNFTLEGMTRAIRFGRNYHCGASGDTSLPFNCDGGANSITVKVANNNKVTYKLLGTRIARTICPPVGTCSPDYFVTSPDVTVNKLTFFVLGSEPYNSSAGSCPLSNDCFQPRVIIVAGGFAGVKPSTQSSFSLQTTVSQRSFDFQ